MTGSSGAARPPSPDRAELHPLHHSAGSVNARYLRCSVRVLSGARGKAGPPWIPAVPRDESRWPCAGGSMTSLHTTRPVSRPAALPACSPRPRTWPDPTDQHRPSRSRLSSRSGHRRRLTSRQAHAQSRSVATRRSYRGPHAAATPPQPAGFSSCHRPRRCAAHDAGQFLSYEADRRRAIPPGSPGRFPGRGPLRTVRATRRGTRLKQAARALQVEARVSCAGGLGAPAGRMRARGGSGHRRLGLVCRG